MNKDCSHDKELASIVCGHHIDSNLKLGFIENSSVPGDLQGWCFACEHLFQKEGAMTEIFKAFNAAKVVCENCYVELKQQHFLSHEI